MAESKARLIAGNFTTTGIPADVTGSTGAGGGGGGSGGIDSADNAMSAGPVTVDSGVTLTVNGYWSVV